MKPKFRASIIGLEKLIEVNKIFFSNSGDIYINNYPGQDFYLMQSTGLHDNNGVEIFDGDIVRLQDELHLIKFEKYRFEADGFWMNWQDDPGDFFSEDAYKKCEVIGNIYENPELLEEI